MHSAMRRKRFSVIVG
ncbi:unnamed protein product [Linum tenue]|uniref:Uncharacterized protein n=1 Tax=Linum tenue TaxID=586396 RepID=A0AAV0I5S0_9ROSI|nr:unnamed protein product [Linum tenue]